MSAENLCFVIADKSELRVDRVNFAATAPVRRPEVVGETVMLTAFPPGKAQEAGKWGGGLSFANPGAGRAIPRREMRRGCRWDS